MCTTFSGALRDALSGRQSEACDSVKSATECCSPLMASWAKYLTSMSVSWANFSSTGFTSSCRVLGGGRVISVCVCVGCVREGEAVLRGSEDVADLLEGLGHVEADVGHLVAGHLEHHRQHVLSGDVRAAHIEQSLTDTHTHARIMGGRWLINNRYRCHMCILDAGILQLIKLNSAALVVFSREMIKKPQQKKHS